MTGEQEKIIKAFPTHLKNDVLSLLKKISLKSRHQISEPFKVNLNNEVLEIPYRIYFKEPTEENLTETELLILYCLFTRHNDGFIRQQKIRMVLVAKENWIAPFVVQLLGEYVIEILLEIEKHLSHNLLKILAHFIKTNPDFYQLSRCRVISYWNCYYRNKFNSPETYVGFQMFKKIDSFIEENGISIPKNSDY
ncbi:MAG: hypothetical protein LH614_19845 [Pyrinomonadaceae bacterium]|nr:hypothetical protein [Pyrinomonadaceae bacterium]